MIHTTTADAKRAALIDQTAKSGRRLSTAARRMLGIA